MEFLCHWWQNLTARSIDGNEPMAEVIPVIFGTALVFALAVRLLFGTPILNRGPIIALFGLGILFALLSLATTVLSAPTSDNMGLVSLAAAAALPAFLTFVAGFGYRRFYHVGMLATLGVFALICVRLLASADLPSTGAALILDVLDRLLAATFLGFATYNYWQDRHDDLDVRRHRSRYFLTGWGAITALCVFTLSPSAMTSALLMSAQLVLSALAIAIAKRPARDLSFTDYAEKFEQFSSIFEKRRLYQEDDLTLERIGDRLLLDNQKVRFLIHNGTGYRRLSDFLDNYRINAAKNLLGDIEEAQTSMEEIAISVGYGSKAPFEAAFNRLVKTTPQDFRRQYLDQADENRPLQLTNSDR